MHYTGIELYPLAWEEVDALHYSDNPLFRELHAAPWETDVEVTPWFTLRKTQIDVASPAAVLPATGYDVVYFDAFAPEKQPEMWDESVFRRLFAAMSPDGILTTYCAKGVVRRLLQSIGFTVERLPGPPGGKREILRARKTPAL